MKHEKRNTGKPPAQPIFHIPYFIFQKFWCKGAWQKVAAGLTALVLLFVLFMYTIAQWYIYVNRQVPIDMGVTFIPGYARYLGLEPKETMRAMIDELEVRNFRLVSYWSDGEPRPGQYSFEELDWQFAMAEAAGAKVSLAVGLRQPRWPECHMPEWSKNLPKEQWAPLLKDYMTAVVQRYKNSPALDSYQLENEFFLKVFGICPDFSRERLVDEYNLVKRLDPNHTLVVSMSNNAIGIPLYEPTPDQWAISVYKRVWDKTLTKRYFEYPIPAWYYGFRAGFIKLTRGHDSFIHELQAEPWGPRDKALIDISMDEQNKSLNAERLHNRFEYGRATGMKKMDLWGAEFWYYRKIILNDPSLWETARQEFARTAAQNAKLDN